MKESGSFGSFRRQNRQLWENRFALPCEVTLDSRSSRAIKTGAWEPNVGTPSCQRLGEGIVCRQGRLARLACDGQTGTHPDPTPLPPFWGILVLFFRSFPEITEHSRKHPKWASSTKTPDVGG
ncbi:hypothetical protein Bbelb_223390 [Branchiostoma belcheri]|nr:hypothetical protein Bbelb_223390 [Branchiostoma belcheri]